MPHSAISPRWANDVVTTADVLIQRRSQASATGTPIPATGPLIAAIDRLGDRHQVGVRAAQVGPGVRVAGRGDAGADDLAGGAAPATRRRRRGR